MTERRPLSRVAIIVAIVGLLACIAGLVVAPARVAAAYLVAYVACLAVVLGCLAMIMIARVTNAVWFVALRRQAEDVVATLPIFALLFLPIAVGVRRLYPWAAPRALMTDDVRRAVQAKAAYLNVPFFMVRAALFLATWIALGELLRRASLEQDGGDSPNIERRMRVTSAAGLVAFAIATSFAAIDWMMSITPAWYSTVYGLIYFAGGMVGAVALLAVLIARARRRGTLPEAIGADHFHALAKLQITFVLLWVYLAFSQLIVIWSAEIPVERTWYATRLRGEWQVLGAVLVAGHFALPFCALLLRSVKRSIPAMTGLAIWLLVMHYLDVYWIVMPGLHAGGGGYWMDAAALMVMVGASVAFGAARKTGQAPVVVGDPAIAASLDYSTE